MNTGLTYRRLVTGIGMFALMLGLLFGFGQSVQAAATDWRYDCALKPGVTVPTGDMAKDLDCDYITGAALATAPASAPDWTAGG